MADVVQIAWHTPPFDPVRQSLWKVNEGLVTLFRVDQENSFGEVVDGGRNGVVLNAEEV